MLNLVAFFKECWTSDTHLSFLELIKPIRISIINFIGPAPDFSLGSGLAKPMGQYSFKDSSQCCMY